MRKPANYAVTCTAGKPYAVEGGFLSPWTAVLVVSRTGERFEYTGRCSMFAARSAVIALARAAGHN